MTRITESDALATDRGRRVTALSGRQLECLSRAGEGLSSKEIARQLGIAPSTVDNHIQAAIGKLDVTNRRQAVRLIDRFRRQNGPKNPPQNAAIASSRDLLPPLGGTENRDSPQTRLLQIVIIAVLSIVVVLGVLLSIAGAVHVLDQ